MKKNLLEFLCCPDCQSDLTLDDLNSESGLKDISEGKLNCRCGNEFSIIRGIPRFVSSEHYAANFGFQWNIHKKTQFDTADNALSSEVFEQKTQWKLSEFSENEAVLDVGVGSGRFADVVQRTGATVIGVDISSAVEAAYESLGDKSNVHIVQADVFRLPFRHQRFDRVFSLGVLHHTPSTKEAFLGLPKLLKPGGQIAIWVYSAYSKNPHPGFNDFYRSITSRLPKRLLYAMCLLAGPLGAIRYYWNRVAPWGKGLLHMILPGILVHGFPKIANKLSARERILNTFDWYSPTYQFKHTYPEVSQWFEEAGLTDVCVFNPEVSVSGRQPWDAPSF